MRYRQPELRDRLASEYVLGTMSARARRRFESLLKYDADLRRLVAEWEARLSPLAAKARPVEPPKRLWKDIEARIAPARRARPVWNLLGFWRTLAGAGIAAALVLAVTLGGRSDDMAVDMVAVMENREAQPAMIVAWPRRQDKEYPYLHVRAVYPPQTLPGTSLELWMLPGGSAPPVSLGVIEVSTDTPKPIRIDKAHMRAVGDAWGVALSMEPKGGSPTGKPTTGFMYEGQCVKVM